jgi:hypothetical protein
MISLTIRRKTISATDTGTVPAQAKQGDFALAA